MYVFSSMHFRFVVVIQEENMKPEQESRFAERTNPPGDLNHRIIFKDVA